MWVTKKGGSACCRVITEASVDCCVVCSLRGTERDGSHPAVQLLDGWSGVLSPHKSGWWGRGKGMVWLPMLFDKLVSETSVNSIGSLCCMGLPSSTSPVLGRGRVRARRACSTHLAGHGKGVLSCGGDGHEPNCNRNKHGGASIVCARVTNQRGWVVAYHGVPSVSSWYFREEWRGCRECSGSGLLHEWGP